MQILHTVGKLGGGIGRLVVDLVEKQVKDKDLTIKVAVKEKGGVFFQRLIQQGVKVEVVEGIRSILRVMKNVNIVHLHSLNFEFMIGAILRKKKQIYTLHGKRATGKGIISGLKRRRINIKGGIRFLKRKMFSIYLGRVATLVTTVSEFLKKESIKIYKIKKENKIVVIPNGINIKKIPQNREKKNGEFTIGTVVRGVKWKRVERLVKGGEILYGNYGITDFKMIVIGKGVDTIWGKEISESRIKNKIKTLPFQKDIFNYYKQMDVFILPSEGEPFGITLLEASYCKLPIIVFEDGGGAVEVARKIGGIIVKNEEELGEKLKELYLNLQKRKYIGEKGYKCVTTYFPMEKIAQKYKEVYLKC